MTAACVVHVPCGVGFVNLLRAIFDESHRRHAGVGDRHEM